MSLRSLFLELLVQMNKTTIKTLKAVERGPIYLISIKDKVALNVLI